MPTPLPIPTATENPEFFDLADSVEEHPFCFGGLPVVPSGQVPEFFDLVEDHPFCFRGLPVVPSEQVHVYDPIRLMHWPKQEYSP